MQQYGTLPDFGGVRISLIDDDASVRSSVSRLLRSHGYLCTTIASGELALTDPAIAESKCLILDIQLTGMDGFETRDRLQAMGLRIPVVFITADSNMESPDWMTRTKGSPCLRKPFEEEELVQTIDRLLASPPR